MATIKKLKILPPTQREKKHYCVIAAPASEKKAAFMAVDDAILAYIGLLGYAKAGVMPVDFNAGKKRLIIAVSRKYVQDVKAALAFSRLQCCGIAGSVKKAKENYY